MAIEDIIKELTEKLNEHDIKKSMGQISIEINLVNGKMGDYTITTKIKTKL